MNELIAPELLRELLRYEPETGKLFWRYRPSVRKCWNTRYADMEAFTSIDSEGYKRGGIFGKVYKAHRVIWAMEIGAWPKHQIDHIDGNKANNVIKNLREATHAENQRNRGIYANNTSGFRGVMWHKPTKKWIAHIKHKGSTKYLGLFSDIESAAAAYADAATKYHGKFAYKEAKP